jgi:hypothetical protein
MNLKPVRDQKKLRNSSKSKKVASAKRVTE